MMAQDWGESTRETINYGRFINQFLPYHKIDVATQKDKYKDM